MLSAKPDEKTKKIPMPPTAIKHGYARRGEVQAFLPRKKSDYRARIGVVFAGSQTATWRAAAAALEQVFALDA